MSGRSPARLLAPLALVVTALALFVLISSGGGGDAASEEEATGNRPAATATAAGGRERSTGRKRRTYTVRRGDTPSSIADKTGVPLDRLLELNPDVDPQLLSPGQKLKLQ